MSKKLVCMYSLNNLKHVIEELKRFRTIQKDLNHFNQIRPLVHVKNPLMGGAYLRRKKMVWAPTSEKVNQKHI